MAAQRVEMAQRALAEAQRAQAADKSHTNASGVRTARAHLELTRAQRALAVEQRTEDAPAPPPPMSDAEFNLAYKREGEAARRYMVDPVSGQLVPDANAI